MFIIKLQIVDLSSEKIFKDATIKNVIPILSKSSKKEEIPIYSIKNSKIYHSHDKNINDLILNEKSMIWDLKETVKLNTDFSKMNKLGEYCFISKGMVLNADEKKAKGEFKKKDLISELKTEIHTKPYIEGKNIEIGFNNRYLLDALKACNTDRVKIQLNGAISPILILPTEGESFIFLVLPVRLKKND